MGKKLDAVALVRRIRDEQHERLEGRTWEERAAFYREQAARLHEQIERRRREEQAPSEPAV